MLEENKYIWYVVLDNGVKQGPFSSKKISDLLDAKKLKYEDSLYSDETFEIRAISDIPEFDRREKDEKNNANDVVIGMPSFPNFGEKTKKIIMENGDKSSPLEEQKNEVQEAVEHKNEATTTQNIVPKKESEYFLYLENQQKGPFTVAQIKTMLGEGKIHFTDYIFTSGADKSQWLMLAEHSSFNRRKKKRSSLPQNKAEDLTNVHLYDIENTRKIGDGNDSLVDYFSMLKQKENAEKSKERTKTIEIANLASESSILKFSFMSKKLFFSLLAIAVIGTGIYFYVNREGDAVTQKEKEKIAKAKKSAPVTNSGFKDFKEPDDARDLDDWRKNTQGKGADRPNLGNDEFGDFPDLKADGAPGKNRKNKRDFTDNSNVQRGADYPNQQPNRNNEVKENRPNINNDNSGFGGFNSDSSPPTSDFDSFGGFKSNKRDEFDIPPPPTNNNNNYNRNDDDFDDWLD